ncbi:MAG: histidine kinase [Bacteroidales bacterium]|nr:histidine kinase [Bacteroidales bacterium]
MLGATGLEVLMVSSGLPLDSSADRSLNLPVLIPISFLTQIAIYCIVYMVNYTIYTQSGMHAEREKAHTAQFRYLKLKRQVDPHFLFNSLNILDCMVCEEQNEQASEYIHKLAGLYRYMIKSEEEEIVPLRDELAFVEQYVDLLKVRFPEGFEVNIDVPEEALSMYVLPCSIQLLIENATKHNAVSIENPLKIDITVSENMVRVSNNIIPKVTKAQSMGLGQKYIRQQYLDMSGKEIEIEDDGKTYCVTLPLL